jgi:hypothetical protein
MSVQAFPLQWPEGWPRTPSNKQERGWQFKQSRAAGGYGKTLVTFAKARDLLYEELGRLGASNVVVSTNHKPDRYGVPTESKRSVDDDAVAIYFTLKARAMAMACDRFDNAAANMRSLGLAIDAMRQLERHGGGTMMERAFAGFVALPKPDGADWWEVLQVPRTVSRATIEAKFRELARARHPDRGGSDHAMAELNRARDQALAEVRS